MPGRLLAPCSSAIAPVLRASTKLLYEPLGLGE